MTSDTSGRAGHRHDRSCYWDHLRCGWVCAPTRTPARPDPTTEPEPADPPTTAPLAVVG